MAVRLKPREEVKPQMQIAPMIDCVFLLLIYFMVSSTLDKQEADLSFQLPGVVEQTESLDMPDEQIIEIRADGQVIVNEFPYDTPGSRRFTELSAMLKRFKQASDSNKVEAVVTIAPDEAVQHQAIVRVMDAVGAAGIKAVNFSLGEEEG
jgi:biopolymer transport protein ExbD